MFILKVYRKMISRYRHARDLRALSRLLKLQKPLPEMGGWAITPDFGLLLARTILRLKPNLVLELGSGVSTLITGYCLKHIGKGKLISWDHDEAYAEKTKALVKEHGLEAYVEIEWHPLKEIEINGKMWKWYEMEHAVPGEINLLTVDGPPTPKGGMTRFPALPLLGRYLAEGATILLDDGKRDLKIAELWGKPFTTVSLEKGAIIIRT